MAVLKHVRVKSKAPRPVRKVEKNWDEIVKIAGKSEKSDFT